jgi:hypothetical protein
MFRIGLVPVILLAGLSFALLLKDGNGFEAWALSTGVDWLLGVLILSQWYQFILQGKEKSFLSIFCIGLREVKLFVGYVLLLAFPLFALNLYVLDVLGVAHILHLNFTGLHALVDSLDTWLVLIALWYVIVIRFLLVFPSIVAEDKIGLKASWDQTKGHWGVLIKSYLLFGICALILSFGLMGLMEVFGNMIQFVKERLHMETHPEYMTALVTGVVYIGGMLYSYFLWLWGVTIPAVLYQKVKTTL